METTLFLVVDCLERRSERIARARLHLAEDEPATPSEHEIELVSPGEDIRVEHRVAPEAIVSTDSTLSVGAESPHPSVAVA